MDLIMGMMVILIRHTILRHMFFAVVNTTGIIFDII